MRLVPACSDSPFHEGDDDGGEDAVDGKDRGAAFLHLGHTRPHALSSLTDFDLVALRSKRIIASE